MYLDGIYDLHSERTTVASIIGEERTARPAAVNGF
jgi:hypothetical protein